MPACGWCNIIRPMKQTQQLSEDQQRVLWLIRLRWGALALIAVVTLYLKYVGHFEVLILPPFIILIVAALYNAVYPVFVKYFPGFSESQASSDVRTVLDLLVISLMIHFTGGIESPFIMLYLLELMAISMFRFRLSAYYLAGLSTVMYLTICLLETYFIIPHYRLSELSGTLFISADYVLAKGFALFFTSALLIYMASFISGKFEERRKQIEGLSQGKVEFMNDVMHETKSPLTSIIGYADIILKGTFGEVKNEQQGPLNIIQRQSKRILDMVNNLLDIARLESGKTKIEKDPCSLNDIIGHAAEEMKPQLDGNKLELVQELSPDLPDIPMDECKIDEVVTNLLSNAVKFSKPNGKIYISTQTNKTDIQVSVRDEGLGIDADDLPHIFEKFHRSSKEAAQVRGTGLGLSLSKTIVERHGGRIWAESDGQGKGAAFLFTLPLHFPA